MEWEGIYNWFIIGCLIVFAIFLLYIFILQPASQKSLEQQNFEKERDVFLNRFCKNIGYNNYKIQDISNTVYNIYCYTEQGNVRTASYFRYDYDYRDGKYYFFIVNNREV